jgi:diguanylate cyclase (GGDEF)-like protein
MPAFVLLSKQYLQREDWEAGMRMLERRPDWDRFPNFVLSSQAHEDMPPALAGRLTDGLPDATLVMKAREPRSESRAVFLPLTDAGGRDVGRMGVLIDVSKLVRSSQQTIYGGAAAGALIVGLLIAFFYHVTGRVGRRIESEERALEHLATHDGLTGLYNHRSFYQLLEEEVARARRYDHPFALLMLDIDHFKQVNDTYGHPAGDAVLRGLSNRLTEQVRIIDRVCRYGGEEIAILLPEMNEEAATATAERLRNAVAATPFPSDNGGPRVSITVSIGVAVFPQDGASIEALATAADQGMYDAKQGGRNRVCHHCNSS